MKHSDAEIRRFPPRPTLTAVFVCALFFWAGCAMAIAACRVQAVGACRLFAMMSMGACAGALVLTAIGKARMVAAAVASTALGVSLGCMHAAQVFEMSDEIEGLKDIRVAIVLLDDSRDFGFGESALVEAQFENGRSAVLSARFSDARPMLCGERFDARGSCARIDYVQDERTWQQGACGTLTVRTAVEMPLDPLFGWLISVRSAAIDALGGDDERGALLQALVCGYRRNVTGTDLYADFQTCGLAHLVAVSGAHLVIVTGLFASLLNRLRVPRKLTIAVLVAVMIAYYVIAGMPISALRAMLMSALGLFAYFGKRRPSSLNAIGVALFALIASSPASSVSASLTLSVLSTTGIVVFAPLIDSWIDRTPLGRFAFAAEALSLTLSASLLSQLYACSLFNQLPLIAPLANIVSAPLFPLACGSGLIGAIVGASSATLYEGLSFMPNVLSGALLAVVGILARAPLASVPFAIETQQALTISGATALMLWVIWPQPDKRLVLVVCGCMVAALLAFFVVPEPDDRLVMLDIGQGDAILITSRGQSLLVDTGNKDSKLLEQLALCHVAHIDSVLITHADDDHCGSLDVLEKSADVDRVLLFSELLSCDDESARKLVAQSRKTAREIVELNMGDAFSVGAFTAHVIWPHSLVEEGGNADSLCIELDYDGDGDGVGDACVFMTGDAEKDQVSHIIDEGLIGDIDVLKVGHHGSRNALTLEEAGILDPEIALISCGAHNRYGHPSPETIEKLESVGAAIYRTDERGPITCLFSKNSISII